MPNEHSMIRTHVLPEDNNHVKLGDATHRFKEIWATTLYGDGANVTGVIAAADPTTGLTAWDSGTIYASGNIVIDREGIWQATGSSTNSQPISGNTDWTLVGGTPYVTLSLLASDINSLNTVPKIDFLPAPGAGKMILLRRLRVTSTVGTQLFNDSVADHDFRLFYTLDPFIVQRDPTGGGLGLLSLLVEGTTPYDQTGLIGLASGNLSPSNTFVNSGLSLKDMTGDSSVIGGIGGDCTSLINSGGTLYAINDTVTVDGSDSTALVKVTAVNGGTGAVEGCTFVYVGTGYQVGLANATTAAPGWILTSSLGAAGSGYQARDVVQVDVTSSTFLTIDTVTGGGGVATYHVPSVASSNTGNITGAGQATVASTGHGTGFTVDIGTVSPGSATGTGFTLDIGTVLPGNGTAKYTVYYQIVAVP